MNYHFQVRRFIDSYKMLLMEILSLLLKVSTFRNKV